MQITLKFLYASIFTVFASDSYASEIILDCYAVDRSVYKFDDGWFSDRVFERRDAEWLPYCTMESLQSVVLPVIEHAVLNLTDRGAKCTYGGLREDGSNWSQFIILDFITGTYAWSQGTEKCTIGSK